ncbi:unnamed protein product [Caenorhabditis sp. 36 PRJEB53466]|nr:unnamed protein product [Caenorhabditis sp. 36 PRJEB53466]
MEESKKHGWIKLEIPANDAYEVMEGTVRRTCRTLDRVLERVRVTVLSTSKPQLIEEDYCEKYYEINYEIEKDESFSFQIIDTCQLFLKTMIKEVKVTTDEKYGYPMMPYQYGSLLLHSADFWSPDLYCHHKGVPLSAIYFGNIQSGTFFNHWEISFWEETLNELDTRRSVKKNRFPLWKIAAEFEFDKRNILTVGFMTQEKMPKQNKKEEVNYQVIMTGAAIRRIIVEPTMTDRFGKDRIRIHFDLNAPPLIRRGTRQNKDGRSMFAQPFFKRRKTIDFEMKQLGKNHGYADALAISDSSIFTIEFRRDVQTPEIYKILSRLRIRTGVSIEFASLQSVNILMGHRTPYNRWTISNGCVERPTSETARFFDEFVKAPLFKSRDIQIGKRLIDVGAERKFSIVFLIEALLSRGAIVKDQLLLNERHWESFLKLITENLGDDGKEVEAALEDLITMIDCRKRLGSVTRCLQKLIWKKKSKALLGWEEEMKDGFMRVRKVIFTPTRVIYTVPEMIMGNRVLRMYDPDGTRILRITFRDDNNQKMREGTTETLLDLTANKYLSDGVVVANKPFGFLGCSNSQMRDNGAYFMLKYTDEEMKSRLAKGKSMEGYQGKIDRTRKSLGKFDMVESIPKRMARFGQCFTQSRRSGVGMLKHKYTRVMDYEGGKNASGEKYTFSDGVGLMSADFAQKVSLSMNLGKAVPSCFQFRLHGRKGVIAIEPGLDDMRKWAERWSLNERYKVDDRKKENEFDFNCGFRRSQYKFVAPASDGDEVEIVKYSAPVPVALNKPFINILDQVAEMQSLECHRRVTGRVEELMDMQIEQFAKQMNEERYCRNKLKEFPRRIDIDRLETTFGFSLASEPFFRSLIKASIKFSITKQIRKEQIPIPKELGRSMLGVVDETGQLQYGQIFVQCTENINIKLPSKTAARRVITGTVLLTKNPCIVAGDVRIFEAVDIPELHHMCDVVVFPQHGPRPHPDEMAGSDLDGDEYSVIWDQQLLLDKNEKPFDFTAEKLDGKYDNKKARELEQEFYVKYLKLDSVGSISNSHLHLSDQYGINSRVCMDLAKKNCQAVDFTKSGVPPLPLEMKWRTDEETKEIIPPEKADRIPDFHGETNALPNYISPRLAGKLFREFKAIDDVIKASEERDEQMDVVIDETITTPGYERFLDSAKEDLANYNGNLRAIMEAYGIKTEGEIISGCIIEMRNRISEKDQDDMSFYNTNQMIETRVTNLISRYREQFFLEFGGFRTTCDEIDNSPNVSNSLHWRCNKPSMNILQKATAWYKACYEEAQSTKETRKLSFAWIVYDVIAHVKKQYTLDSDTPLIGGENPMYTMLEKHRKQFLADFPITYKFLLSRLEAGEMVERAKSILNMYFEKNPGLKSVVFILLEWAGVSDLFRHTPLRKHHFALIFILFATQKHVYNGVKVTFFDKIDEEKYAKEKEEGTFKPNDELSENKKSDMMIKFLEFLSSRKFRKMPNLSFCRLGFESIFMRGEWHIFHVAALKTYYTILFNLRFDELRVSTDPEKTARTIIREIEPFVIELPQHCSPEKVRESLLEHSGCLEIEMRCLVRKRKEHEEQHPTERYLVSCRGTLESTYRLTKLVSIMIPTKSHFEGKDVSKQIGFLVHKKIMDGLI